MNMYVGMMAAVLALAYVMRGDKPENKDYIWLSCLLMFALCGLRDVYSIGIDSATSYVSIFRRLGETDWADIPQGNNMGFTYLLKLCHTLTDGDYQSFYMLYTAFFMVIFGRFVSKYSPSPVQSFCYFWGLLCYIFLFDGIKQGIAMGFITLAFDAIVEKKPLWFALLVYIAWWFHAPALIFAPAYLIAMMKPGRMYLLFLAALLAFTYTFRDRILELMLEFYDTTIYDYEMRFLANKVIIMLGIVAAALVLRPPEEDDRVYGILLQFMGIAVVIQTFASYNNTFERLANYYFQFCVAFIPLVFQADTRRSQLLDLKTEAMAKQLAPWAFCAFGVWRFANYIQANNWLWLPYRFFFE
ncbi:MAG: EpsG family protein [Oscillospiraceae bacterium]|nr:EpsG family protein [Oscillospiraceae bacterium]